MAAMFKAGNSNIHNFYNEDFLYSSIYRQTTLSPCYVLQEMLLVMSGVAFSSKQNRYIYTLHVGVLGIEIYKPF